MCWRYSSSVVAPMQDSSPRASAGFSRLAASSEPSPLPAPTRAWISSMNSRTAPPACCTSVRMARTRSSNSPRSLAPAMRAPRSSANSFLPCRLLGTSPAAMRWASPSTMAVLPTPGSPTTMGLFLPRRPRICMTRRISSSRPITGSSLPCAASSVRSRAYRLSVGVAMATSGAADAASVASVGLPIGDPARRLNASSSLGSVAPAPRRMVAAVERVSSGMPSSRCSASTWAAPRSRASIWAMSSRRRTSPPR